MPYITFPSDDVIWDATLSMTSPSSDLDYRIEHAQENDPANTARASGTSTIVSVGLDAPVQVVAAAVINTNATSITVTSEGPGTQAITIPSRTPDEKHVNGWVTLDSTADWLDDNFNFHLSKTGSTALEFGRLCLVTALRDIEIVWAGAGASPVYRVRRPGEVEVVTRLGRTHRRPSPTYARGLAGTVIDASFFPLLKQLEAESRGLDRGFLFIPDRTVNDAWFAQLPVTDFEWTREFDVVTQVRLTIEEISMGLATDLT